ncbi:MAG: SRPBCC domain-containing protein [Bacteroidia bacterium]|nr:SRPBCC domain-containing protein [Bacteroidia bacterium]
MERIKLQLKYTFDCDPRDLFLALSKPAYLQNWIADEVEFDPQTGVYTFHWESFSESAKVDKQKMNEYLRWTWVEAEDREETDYIEFTIRSIPGDEYIDLHIVDFCDPLEETQVKTGWDKQMTRLERLLM